MVLLHLARNVCKYRGEDLIAAHFDHGIREKSAEDAEFVRRKAEEYGVECRIGYGGLGAGVSEAEARRARYEFLYSVLSDVCDKNGDLGEIWTAHHIDDLVESVAINFIRGTGWRGLAALDNQKIRRPFLDSKIVHEPIGKKQIFDYATRHELIYREDPSNSWDEYLRNRIRHKMNEDQKINYAQKMQLYKLWQHQKSVKAEVDQLINMILPAKGGVWRREWFKDLEKNVALELLRRGTQRIDIEATRPQLENFRQAILTYTSGKCFNLPGDRLIKLKRDEFEM